MQGTAAERTGDPDRAVDRRYALERIPRTYVISRDGKILYQTPGFSLIEHPHEINNLRESIERELTERH
jgi:hypothetical protein